MRELAAVAVLASQPGGRALGRLGPTLAVRAAADAPAAILDAAPEAGCDLIVMGTHRPSARGTRRGGTADGVRRHATCPAVLVPPAAEPAVSRFAPSESVDAALAAAS